MRRLLERLRASANHWIALSIVVVVALAYSRVTSVHFYADDFGELLVIADRGFAYFILRPISGHVAPFRNLVVGLPYATFGLRAEPYAWLLLAVHLLNTWLLFRVALLMSNYRALAALGALVWGVWPLHANTLNWFAVLGHMLSATTLLAALSWLVSREQNELPSPRALASALAVTVLGVLCTAHGTVIGLVFPLVVALLAPGVLRTRYGSVIALCALPVTLALYFFVPWISTTLYGPLPLLHRMGMLIGLMSINEALATLAALAMAGASGVLFALLGLAGELRTSWPAVGAYACLALAALAFGNGQLRRTIAALALLAAVVYGGISLGRGWLVSPAETAAEPRHQYIASLMVVLVPVLSLAGLASRFQLPLRYVEPAVTAWAIAVTYASVRHTPAFDTHEACRASVGAALSRIERSVVAQSPDERDVHLPNEEVPNCFMYPSHARSAGIFALAHPTDELHGRRVHFLTSDAVELSRAANLGSRRLSQLLVAHDGAVMPPARWPGAPYAEELYDEVMPELERAGARLGCESGWRTRSFVKTMFSDPRCGQESRDLVACIKANIATVASCDENELRVDPAACGPQVGALLACSTD